MNVLILTSRLPFPPIGGDKLRTFNFIKHISERHRLTLVSFIEHEHELESIGEYRKYCHKLITVRLPKTKSYLNCATGLFSPEPLQVRYYASARMREAVDAELAAEHYDVVVCHLIRMAQYLPARGSVRTVIDFTDAISMSHSRGVAFRMRGFSRSSVINVIEARRVRPYEEAAMRKADCSIFISAIDADYLADAVPRDRVAIVTNGVDLDQFPFGAEGYDRNRIVFLGNMRTFPNTDAALYFANDVFPLVRQSRPEATFHVVGNQPSRRVRELHDGRSIFVTGRVESVVPFLREAAVVVAPMRVSAGIQNKILEALAIGTPVVATPLAARAFDANVIRVAESPGEIARATLQLMEDEKERRRLSLAGRAYIEQNHTWEKALAGLDALLGDPRATRPAARDGQRASEAAPR